MASPGWNDDETLLAALEDALRASRTVPPTFIDAAKALYAWHNIDAELAALTYDSSREEFAGAITRAEPASLRALTYAASNLTIELHVSDGVLRGQIVPPQPGELRLHHTGDRVTAVSIDDIGYFTAGPVPSGSFRLSFQTADGARILTDWITV